MKRNRGIIGLLIFICVVTTLYNPLFVTDTNLYNIVRWTALYGIISIGAAFTIITGGIDLSIGSVVGLTGCLLAIFLRVDFTTTPHRYTVREVNQQARTLLLDQAPAGARYQDKLQLRDHRTGQPRQLTLQGEDDSLNTPRVTVLERVDWVRPGDRVTLLRQSHINPVLAGLLVMLVAVAIGVIHGLLITKLSLQPFVVTLCGLLFYRGLTRVVAGDQNVGFGVYHEGLKYLARGKPFSLPVPFAKWVSEGHWHAYAVSADGGHRALEWVTWIPIPMPFLIMVALALLAGLFLNRTIWGRYLLALGRNEQAARLSGINTDRMTILAYVICSAMAGLGGILFVLDLNSVQPASHGSYYELYAIAAAVLGGCSLRGGEGSIFGVVIGAAVMRALRNSINMMKIPTHLEFAIIGLVILAGVAVDEIVKRMVAKRRAILQARALEAENETRAEPSP